MLAAARRVSCRRPAARLHERLTAPAIVGSLLAAPMNLSDIPFQAVDWSALAPTAHPGDPGQATWRTVEAGNVRARVVEYSAGYVADHWCERGHVVFVLEGEIETELRDGRRFFARAGQGYVVADGDGAHRSRAPTGAKLFIVD